MSEAEVKEMEERIMVISAKIMPKILTEAKTLARQYFPETVEQKDTLNYRITTTVMVKAIVSLLTGKPIED